MNSLKPWIYFCVIALLSFGCGDDDIQADETQLKLDGEACSGNEECDSQTCLIVASDIHGMVGANTEGERAYCSRECQVNSDCKGHESGLVACGHYGDLGQCEPACRTSSDCAEHEICLSLPDRKTCLPNYQLRENLPESLLGTPSDTPKESLNKGVAQLECATEVTEFDEFDKEWTFTVELPADAVSFMVVVESEEGWLSNISSEQVDFNYEDTWDTWFSHGWVFEGAVMQGFSDLGHPASIIQPGLYTFTIRDKKAPCYRVYTPRQLGSRVDINIFNLSDLELEWNEDENRSFFEESLHLTSSILGQTGLHIGQVKMMNITEQLQSEFREIEDFEHLDELFGTMGPNVLSEVEKHSINVFIVEEYGEDMNLAGAAALMMGVPGLQGTHAGGISVGLVPTMFRLDPWDFSQTLAHEIGHYLGLDHTTKLYAGEGFEPYVHEDLLDDTPTCNYDLNEESSWQDCEDGDYMMYGNGSIGYLISEKQGLIMRSSALVY